MAGGLQHENVGAAHVFQDLHVVLAVGKTRDLRLPTRDAEERADLVGERLVRRPAEDLELVVVARALRLAREDGPRLRRRFLRTAVRARRAYPPAKSVRVACTHATLSGKAVERLRNAELAEFICTDTVNIAPAKRLPNFRILTVAPLLGEVIRRTNEARSVGEYIKDT